MTLRQMLASGERKAMAIGEPATLLALHFLRVAEKNPKKQRTYVDFPRSGRRSRWFESSRPDF